MRIFTILSLSLCLCACDPADLQKAMDVLTETPLTPQETASGLKEALNFGVDAAVAYLSVKDGYYKSPYKILLPEQARTVTEKLSVIPGFTHIEEVILEKINRGAEDAAQKAGPIFVSAIKQITFDDAMGILLGEQNAATSYLHRTTHDPLYNAFEPVIEESLNKFNAIQYWEDAVNAYNQIPFVEKMNPRLEDYVTERALVGLFSLVEKKEIGIRQDISQRVTPLLKKVFAKQDN